MCPLCSWLCHSSQPDLSADANTDADTQQGVSRALQDTHTRKPCVTPSACETQFNLQFSSPSTAPLHLHKPAERCRSFSANAMKRSR